MLKQRLLLAAVTLLIGTSLAQAAQYASQSGPLYVGAGINNNSVSEWGSSSGFQLFGGYRFGRLTSGRTPLNLAVEAGYMDTGSFQRMVATPYGPMIESKRYQGPWATGVVTVPIAENVDLLARLGLDLGDDSGLMAGVGAGIHITRAVEARVEYVSRPNVDSLQLNFVFYPSME